MFLHGMEIEKAVADFQKIFKTLFGINRNPRTPAEITLAVGIASHNTPKALEFIDAMGSHNFNASVMALGQWIDSGRPVFRLSKDLCAALLLTDAKNIPFEDVAWPFPSFTIQLPDGYDSLFLTHGFGKTETIHSIQVSLHDSPVKVDADRMASAISALSDDIMAGKLSDWTIIDECLRDIQDVCTEGTKRFSQYWVTDDGNDYITLRDYFPEEGTSLEEWFADAKKALDQWDAGDGTPIPTEEKNNTLAIKRLVSNLCLYISMKKEARALPRGKRKKHRGRPTTSVYSLGSQIKLPSQLHTAAAAFGASNRNPDAWTVRKRFIVRGHFRNQACGPQRKEHKRIYIEPFWKGPTSAEALDRVYKAMTHEEAGLTDA